MTDTTTTTNGTDSQAPAEAPAPAATKPRTKRATKPRTKRATKPAAEAPAPAAKPRQYTKHVTPTGKVAARDMLTGATPGPRGTGLLQEMADAATRYASNAAASPTAKNTADARGWHDRTVSKVIAAIRVTGGRVSWQPVTLRDGTVYHKASVYTVASVTKSAATLTGYGTANGATRASDVAMKAAQTTKRSRSAA